jgi:cyclopropane fatty-acyl-phospholipid synthase-like methyltransferase
MGTPDPTKEWVRAYYAETTELIFQNWAGSVHAFHLGLDDGTCGTRDDALAASNAYLADRARIGPGTKVLDAGCGVGGSSLWLARHRGASVVGITIAPEQVAIAERLAQEAGLGHLATFLEMDFAATTFAKGSFDVVWNIESMCHAFDKPAYLRHVHDLLAKGGRFACLDMFSAPGADESVVDAMCKNWSLTSLPSVESVCAALRDSGFEGVESEDVTERVRRPVEALRAMALNTQQMLRLEKATIGATSRVYEAHVAGALACAEGVASGSFQYAYVGASKV